MCLKISQRNFRSGDLLIYITSRLIWYVWYVMQAKCWWPYLGHKINSQCNRVWHNTLPPYAASRWLCYLFIAIPTSQGMPTNMIEIFPFVTDRVDIMCSVHILSADTTQRPWALLLCFILTMKVLKCVPKCQWVPLIETLFLYSTFVTEVISQGPATMTLCVGVKITLIVQFSIAFRAAWWEYLHL